MNMANSVMTDMAANETCLPCSNDDNNFCHWVVPPKANVS